jgi:hypothetical protein
MKAAAILHVIVTHGWSDFVAVTALLPIVGIPSGLAWALYVSFLEQGHQSDAAARAASPIVTGPE